MRIFVATRDGALAGEVSAAVEGELVRLPVVCTEDECTCQHSMTGLASGAVTTTFTVRDFEIEPDMYRDLLWSTLERDGWVHEDKAEDVEWVDLLTTVHMDLADNFRAGEPLRLEGDTVVVRTSPGT